MEKNREQWENMMNLGEKQNNYENNGSLTDPATISGDPADI